MTREPGRGDRPVGGAQQPHAARALEGRRAVVTGAARGLGRAIALRLADAGAAVAVLDRDLKSAAEYRAEAEQRTADSVARELTARGADAMELRCDVTSRAAVSAAVGEVEETWGAIDILVCNAGGGTGPVGGNRASQIDMDDLDAVLRSNLYGTVHCCAEVSAGMKRRGAGSIVTMASVNGLAATDDGSYAHYAMAKAAVVQYTRYLARDLGPFGIRANAVAPGTIATGRLMTRYAENGQSPDSGAAALRRIGEPDDVASAVAFLAGPAARHITGQVLTVDGGILRGA